MLLESNRQDSGSRELWVAQANVYLNHREFEQAYVDDWLAQNGTGERLAAFPLTRIHPHQTRWTVRPYRYGKRTSGTE